MAMSCIKSVSDSQIQTYFEEALKLVSQASELINKVIGDAGKKCENKSCAIDIVTETDTAVEKILVEGLKKQFPDHKFIGEESTASHGSIEEFSDGPTWIIDPIDGTLNFFHSHPLVSISVALAIGRKIVIGIVCIPTYGQMYTAIRGQGAKLNGKTISVRRDCKSLNQALVIFELHPRAGEKGFEKLVDHQMETLGHLMKHSHGFRCLGSAAINLAFVAAGQADTYFHNGIHCWDMAAGALLVQEAGGVVLDYSGGLPFDFMSRRIMAAATQELAQDIDKLVQVPLFNCPRDLKDICPL